MNKYEIEYWINTKDGYDNRYITVYAKNSEQALHIAEGSDTTWRGKDFKIIKVNDKEI